MLQVESHPYFRSNNALRQWCASEGIHVTAYSPLGSPDSAAMFKRSTRALLEEPAVLEVAGRLGKTAGQARQLRERPAMAVMVAVIFLSHAGVLLRRDIMLRI